MLLLLLGCQGTVLVGQVATRDGGPIVGATLTSPGCVAVTGAEGRFRVGCEPGTRSFTVSHPEHLDRTWLVNAEGYGDVDVGGVDLAAIPLGEGLWLAGDDALTPLPQGPLVRTAAADKQRWCFDASRGGPLVVGPHVRLLDNHTVDWRVYTVDEEGCVWRMSRSGADHWTFEAERIPVQSPSLRGEGRGWIELELDPGDYAIVEWYEGFLVPADDGSWRSHWLRVEGRSERPPIVPEPVLGGADELKSAP